MGRVLFCIHNVKPAERERLESAGACARDCLERCRQCFESPFVVVEDELRHRTLLEGETHDEVLGKLESNQPG